MNTTTLAAIFGMAVSTSLYAAEEQLGTDINNLVLKASDPTQLVDHGDKAVYVYKANRNAVAMQLWAGDFDKLKQDCGGNISEPHPSLKVTWSSKKVRDPAGNEKRVSKKNANGLVPCYEIPTRAFVEKLVADRIDAVLPVDATSGAVRDNLRALVQEETSSLEDQVRVLRAEIEALKASVNDK